MDDEVSYLISDEVLPCGLIVNDKVETKVVFREMSGFEENILVDKRSIRNERTGVKRAMVSGFDRITKILARCTIQIGDNRYESNKVPIPGSSTDYEVTHAIWDNARSADRSYAIVQLRRLTHGDTHKFESECDNCGKKLKRIVTDLSTLKVDQVFSGLEEEERASKILETSHTVTLPSGKIVEWELLNKRGEELLEKMDKTLDSIVSTSLLGHILKIDDKKANSNTIAALSSRDTAFLRNYFDEVEGGIDTLLSVSCDNCDELMNYKLNLGLDFFFPSGT